MSDHGSDVQAHLHDDALSLGQRLAKLAIKRILAPLIVAGHISLDEAIEQIKLEVVAALADTGEANGFLAGHVSKSRSWFQDHLRKARSAEREARRLDANRSLDGADEQSGESYHLMLEVLAKLLEVYPETMTLPQLREAADLPTWRLDDAELVRRLAFYEKLGGIQIVGYDSEGPVFRASERLAQPAARPGQLERVAERLGWIMPLAQAYCQGKGDFGGFIGRLSPRALEKARGRLRDAVADIFAEAIADTHKSEDPAETNVWVRVIIAIGETGGFDGR